MPRKKLIRAFDLPYHITARSNNREPFAGDLNYVWKVLTDELYLQQILHGVQIHAFVLMPNHFHLLATSANRGVDLVMKEVLGSSTRILNTRNRRSGHVFGGRYHWSLVRQSDYFVHALKYVLRNPVKAGLCEKVADYPFSSYSGLLGYCPLPVAITPPLRNLGRILLDENWPMDDWLNQPHPAELNTAIQKALRRKEFEFAPTNTARRKPEFSI